MQLVLLQSTKHQHYGVQVKVDPSNESGPNITWLFIAAGIIVASYLAIDLSLCDIVLAVLVLGVTIFILTVKYYKKARKTDMKDAAEAEATLGSKSGDLDFKQSNCGLNCCDVLITMNKKGGEYLQSNMVSPTRTKHYLRTMHSGITWHHDINMYAPTYMRSLQYV